MMSNHGDITILPHLENCNQEKEEVDKEIVFLNIFLLIIQWRA